MSQLNRETRSTSRGIFVSLIVLLVLILVVLGASIWYSHLPRETGNPGGIDGIVTPVATQTNTVGTVQVNRSIDFSGVNLTVMHATEAGAFSDDSKHAGKYTVRVYMQAMNAGSAAVGIDYFGLTRLMLPDGSEVAPQMVTLTPVVLPSQKQAGFMDFPVSDQVAMPQVLLRMGSKAKIPFSA